MSRIFEIHTPEGDRCCTEQDLPLVIGAGGHVHVPLPAGREVEARLGLSRGYLFLQPESGSRILHNNTLISRSVWIKSGDQVRIGGIMLRFHLSGDLVDIRVREEGRADGTGPAAAAPEEPPPAARSGQRLPRVAMAPPRRRKSLWLATGLLFLLLCLSAAFLLAARTVDIAITPAPDRLTVEGILPLLHMGDRFVGLDGTYTVRASRRGYRELVREITVAAGSSQFAFTLEKRPGTITIVSSPAGAAVRIDGRKAGVTPLAGVELAAGVHRVVLSLARYRTLDQQVEVEGLGRRQRFTFRLLPGWGELHLASRPAGARVLEGERKLGRTPLMVELMAGRHRLLVRKDGYSDGLLEIDVAAGERYVPQPLVLEPAPARVRVSSTPGGAALTVDSVFQGKTPLTVEVASRQEHRFYLRLAGHRPVTITKQFAPATETALQVRLEPGYGTIFLSSVPPDAELLVDGKPHGRATGRLRLTTRKHSLTVRARGYRSVTRKVTPAAGAALQLDIRLQREGVAPGNAPATGTLLTGGAAGKGVEMIILGPARFRMGASRREPGRRANEQQRDIELRRPFALAVRPVTNGEFRRFRPAHRSGMVGGHSLDTDRQPVVNVTWDDAARYCNWLSDRHGLPRFYRETDGRMITVLPVTSGYRLPTEAEWAFAARMAGRDQPARYPWPGAFPPHTVAGNFADESARGLLPLVISGYNDGHAVTAPVGSYPANPGGFFDMGGNVAQWCHDFYTVYAAAGTRRPVSDPLGPATGRHHVLRGSGWRDAAITELRLSYRGYGRKGRDDLGFRVARYLAGQPAGAQSPAPVHAGGAAERKL